MVDGQSPMVLFLVYTMCNQVLPNLQGELYISNQESFFSYKAILLSLKILLEYFQLQYIELP